MKRILLSIILVLIICTQSLAESSVWKIQKNESVMFLGGTIHVLRQSDFPLPPEFQKAYRESDILVFEIDLGKFKEEETAQKLISKAMYADGSTIDKHLSSKTYSLLNEYCASIGIPLTQIKQFKPSIIVAMMTGVELAKFGAVQNGVDMFFYQLATKDKKFTEGLETIDEQIHFTVGAGVGNEDAFITHSINNLKSINQQYDSMVDAWRTGDVKKLNDMIIAEMKTTTLKLYKELLTDRNEYWLPKIDAYLGTPRKEFILVGAAHLVGTEGIVEALRQKGYKVEKL